MKKIIIGILLATSFSELAHAQVFEDNISLKAYGEVRLMGSVKVLLENYLRGEYTIRTIDDSNFLVEVDTKFNGWDYFGFERRADVNIIISNNKTNITKTLNIKCNAEVNDGGNQTIKYSCIKKMAHLINLSINP